MRDRGIVDGIILRHAQAAEDWRAVRDLCCLTGRVGDPIESARWPFFAELWVGPYQRLRPEWTYVAVAEPRVVGYLTGCPDTTAFRRARVFAFTLPLLLQVLGGCYGRSGDTQRFVWQALGLEASVERRVRRVLPRHLERDYPAHLHMNVGTAARGRGVGRLLLARYLTDLGERGVAGVHLFCGGAARVYYVQHGFTDLGAVEARAGVTVHALGRRLAGRPLA